MSDTSNPETPVLEEQAVEPKVNPEPAPFQSLNEPPGSDVTAPPPEPEEPPPEPEEPPPEEPPPEGAA